MVSNPSLTPVGVFDHDAIDVSLDALREKEDLGRPGVRSTICV